MKEFYILRNPQQGKYYRKLSTIGEVVAACDVDLSLTAISSLFMFETPEQAFQFLKTGGKPLPLDTEVVPLLLTTGKPINLIEIPEIDDKQQVAIIISEGNDAHNK